MGETAVRLSRGKLSFMILGCLCEGMGGPDADDAILPDPAGCLAVAGATVSADDVDAAKNASGGPPAVATAGCCERRPAAGRGCGWRRGVVAGAGHSRAPGYGCPAWLPSPDRCRPDWRSRYRGWRENVRPGDVRFRSLRPAVTERLGCGGAGWRAAGY